MFCPSCGANNSTELSFCRACGMNLEQTAASLIEQFPTAKLANLEKRARSLERFGQIAFGGFGAVILTALGAIIYLIVTKLILTGANFWSGILLVAFIVFAGLALAYVFLAESLKEKRNKVAHGSGGSEIEGYVTGNLLAAPNFEPAASVVEDTTELLVLDRPRRKV